MRRFPFISPYYWSAIFLVIMISPGVETFAQTRHEGTAVIQVGEGEYTVPIECDDASRPELGFSTEPSRITRERTGRTSGVNIRLRASGEENESIVTLDRYVAWLPQPTSSSGTLSMTMNLSPISEVRDGQPVMLTRDMWMDGDRPEGLKGVKLEAQCSSRNPEAPSYKKLEG